MTLKTRNLIAKSTLASAATMLAILGTTASSWAQSTAPAMEGTAPAAAGATSPMTAKELMSAFTKSDANKDGKLSKDEAAGVPGLVTKFEAIDTDGDKFISKTEFEKAIQ
jgi:EF hand